MIKLKLLLKKHGTFRNTMILLGFICCETAHFCKRRILRNKQLWQKYMTFYTSVNPLWKKMLVQFKNISQLNKFAQFKAFTNIFKLNQQKPTNIFYNAIQLSQYSVGLQSFNPSALKLYLFHVTCFVVFLFILFFWHCVIMCLFTLISGPIMCL